MAPKGIHARPSALLVQAANKFKSEIHFELDGIEANAKNILEIISLGARYKDVLKIRISGPDEKKAFEEIRSIFTLNFNDNQ